MTRAWILGLILVISLSLTGCREKKVETFEIEVAVPSTATIEMNLAEKEESVIEETESNALEPVPYLAHLDQFWETGIEADMRFAEDMGTYYVVPGTVRIPVTITEEELQELKGGKELEVIVDELTGETRMLRPYPGVAPSPNCFYFFEKGTEPDENSWTANAEFDEKNGVYTLWWMSDDTIMKNVYEGDLYIKKGAVTGAHVSLEEAKAEQREIGMVREGEPEWHASIFGNYVEHDGNGYFTAVYYIGD